MSGRISLGKIGCRKMMKQGFTARDYIQDGLVAMWDGIENAGWGVHDPNATVWKDLTGNGFDLDIGIGCTVENDAILFASKNRLARRDGRLSPLDVEFVLQRTNTSNTYALFWQDNTTLTYGDSQATRAIGFKGGFFGQNKAHYFPAPDNGATPFACNYRKDPARDYCWINGREIAKGTASEPWTITENTISIGGRTAGNTNNFIGRVKCFRAYDRNLTAAEIAANYAVDKARFNLPDAT